VALGCRETHPKFSLRVLEEKWKKKQVSKPVFAYLASYLQPQLIKASDTLYFEPTIVDDI
jgi:hypothetical protein